ncbi:MAG TPA: hypothetical protein VGR22_10280 [Thermomicrobiales bacterium]|nr:hypothetical protein [Thermomicrobiales bacterium]
MHRRHLLKTIAAGMLAPFGARISTATANEPPPLTRAVRVETGPVVLRAEPSLRGHVIATIPSGCGGTTPDTPFEKADGYHWAPLTLGDAGLVGWVPTWHLSAIDG